MDTSPTSKTPSSPTSRASPASSRSSPPAGDDAPSSPPKTSMEPTKMEEKHAYEAAKRRVTAAQARLRSLRDRRKSSSKRKVSEGELKASMADLDKGLKEIESFGRHLMENSAVLGRVGTGLDGTALGDHHLELATQPESMTGGVMKDYQLEGLTWMFNVAVQKQCGILADEMGLGKTVQAISWLTMLRDLGVQRPHLVVCPLSTLDNWVKEIKKWTPTMPVTKFHGTLERRDEVYDFLCDHYSFATDKTDDKFPIVCTTFEMISKDRFRLAHFAWDQVFIDEGHRIKNCDSKTFDDLAVFKSQTRFLLTGTPLQNEMKELYSLIHFLYPTYFNSWEAFDAYFNFDAIKDEETTREFIEDKKQHGRIKKVHFILHALMLRRVKADVLQYLPKKREYILYAPLTEEQLGLYRAITDKNVNARKYLEDKVVGKIQAAAAPKEDEEEGEISRPEPTKKLAIRQSPRKSNNDEQAKTDPPPKKPNAFSVMMGAAPSRKSGGRPKKTDLPSKLGRPTPTAAAAATSAHASSRSSNGVGRSSTAPAPRGKRKAPPVSDEQQENDQEAKSNKTSRESTPGGGGTRRATRLRKKKLVQYEVESDDSDLEDDEFERRLVAKEEEEQVQELEGDSPIAKSYDLARKEIAQKKFGNPKMQVRLVCNSPHMCYAPWRYGDAPVDETIITSSGKMLLLDQLLQELLGRGHKVLIFSQFVRQLDILEDYCLFRHHGYHRLDGSVSVSDRQAMIDDFSSRSRSSSGAKIFLLSTRAGGLGITLTAADTVVLFDSDWNPQQDLQAQDRCHRITQDRPVVVYRLATRGTVEEDLLRSAAAKRRLEKLVIRKGGLRTMGRQMDEVEAEGLDRDELERLLLLRDGKVFTYSGGGGDDDKKKILSQEDLDLLCDRSDAAYERAARGEGNASGFEVIETAADGVKRAGGGEMGGDIV